MVRIFSFLLFILPLSSLAQTYQSFIIGNPSDTITPTQGGIVLMGGGIESDEAIQWFLSRSGGGDIVVLRTAGDDSYNDYFFNDLGIAVHSVETIITPSLSAAQDPYVTQQILNAEAVWISGGDQATYVTYWKDKNVEQALQYLISTKKSPIGGTSAGMMIQGDGYFTALNGTTTSAAAMSNPYRSSMNIGYNDFLSHPILEHTITDTHFDNPNRKGRLTAFLARLTKDYGIRAKGIACEEHTAVCIDSSGIATVFGGFPTYRDYAYFVQVNCTQPNAPETCMPGQPLNWVRNNRALKVYRIAGRPSGSGTFNLNDWKTGSGGIWQHWRVNNGTHNSTNGTIISCPTTLSAASPDSRTEKPTMNSTAFSVFPNPTTDKLIEIKFIGTSEEAVWFEVQDATGKSILLQKIPTKLGENQAHIQLPAHLSPGVYNCSLESINGRWAESLIVH